MIPLVWLTGFRRIYRVSDRVRGLEPERDVYIATALNQRDEDGREVDDAALGPEGRR